MKKKLCSVYVFSNQLAQIYSNPVTKIFSNLTKNNMTPASVHIHNGSVTWNSLFCVMKSVSNSNIFHDLGWLHLEVEFFNIKDVFK